MIHTVTVLDASHIDVVSADEPVRVVETAAAQGPQGPQGPAGGSASYRTVSALGGHRAVCLQADGLHYADASTLAHAGLTAGITPGAVEAGASTTPVSNGELIEPSWRWEVDRPVFVGLDGTLTQTLPQSAVFSQVVGVATSSTSLFVRLHEPVIL